MKQINATFARICSNSPKWDTEVLADFTNCSADKQPTLFLLIPKLLTHVLLQFKLVWQCSPEQQQLVIAQLQSLPLHFPLAFSKQHRVLQETIFEICYRDDLRRYPLWITTEACYQNLLAGLQQ